MKILGVIPARGGSKGIPKKNIKLLCGKPLIEYTISPALKSQLDKVLVSTDSEEIAKISISLGAEVLSRPEELARDDTTTLSVLIDLISKINEKYDAVMVLQPTSPFRTLKHINEAINIFKKDYESDSLVSVIKVPHNFLYEKQMKLENNYLIGNKNILSRQNYIDEFYARNGAAIYISKIKNLKKSILGNKVKPFLMNKIDSIDIDDYEDWEIAESIMLKKKMIK